LPWGAARLTHCLARLPQQVYNTVTKLFQVPLLSIATTTVAAARGAEAQQKQEAAASDGPTPMSGVSAAASSALAVALGVGLLVATALLAGGPALARVWGVGASSPLRGPLMDFLTLRALGAPISIMLLVTQVRG
jgi:hypothetical protein